MRQLFLFLFFQSAFFANAQDATFPKKHFQFFAGTSYNGTGDISGFAFKSEFGLYFKKKSSFQINMGGTIHDKVHEIFYTDQSGKTVDGSVRATIAGFQIAGLYGYSFVRTQKDEFLIKVGPVVRYQSSSYWDQLGEYSPIITGVPFPVVDFINLSPQRTFAIGGNLALAYNYTISNKVSIGILGEFQTDSNGDTISQLLFSVGTRF